MCSKRETPPPALGVKVLLSVKGRMQQGGVFCVWCPPPAYSHKESR